MDIFLKRVQNYSFNIHVICIWVWCGHEKREQTADRIIVGRRDHRMGISGSQQSAPSPNHRSILLKGYDYPKARAYFATIWMKDRECLFGDIVNQRMVLNDAGWMMDKWYGELEINFRISNVTNISSCQPFPFNHPKRMHRPGRGKPMCRTFFVV